MTDKSFKRLQRRYEQTKYMTLPERHKYTLFLSNLWYLLTRAYKLPASPTIEDYKAYQEWCELCRDILGID